MCVENCPPPSNRLTRRGVLAGAAALAGTTAALAAAPGASAAPMARTSAARSGNAPRGGDLVIDGGTLLDPATGEVTEDAVVVIRDGVVRAAGRRKTVDVPAGVTVLDAQGRWVLPGLVDSHIHLNTAAEAARTLALGATTARSGSTNFYQDIAVRELSRQAPGLAPGCARPASSSRPTSVTRSSRTPTSPRSPASRAASPRPRRCAASSRSTWPVVPTPSRRA